MKQLDFFIPEETKRSNSWCTFNKSGRCYGEVIGIKTGDYREPSYLVRCVCDMKPVTMFGSNIIKFYDNKEQAKKAHNEYAGK